MSDHAVNFEIESKTLYVDNFPVPNKKALVVDKEVINIVSNRYKIVQPKTVLETFQKRSGLEINNVITNPSTGGILLSSTVNKGTDYSHDIVFYTGHDGKFRTTLTLQTLRLACMNQCATLIGERDQHLIYAKHYEDLDFQQLAMLLEVIPTAVKDFEFKMNSLSNMKLSLRDFIELYIKNKNLQDDKNLDRKIDQMKAVYHNAQGQSIITTDSAFKAFNTITYMNTHKVRDSKLKLENQYLRNVQKSSDWYDQIVQAAS